MPRSSAAKATVSCRTPKSGPDASSGIYDDGFSVYHLAVLIRTHSSPGDQMSDEDQFSVRELAETGHGRVVGDESVHASGCSLESAASSEIAYVEDANTSRREGVQAPACLYPIV